METLYAVCLECKNFFDRYQPKIFGEISIVNGAITNTEFSSKVKLGQYFRIVGSIFNDGVYCFGENLELTDETFSGGVWLLAIPKPFIKLCEDIEAWKTKNADALNSPYQSESFGGYSYTKAQGKNGSITWQDAFDSQLEMYRRIRI